MRIILPYKYYYFHIANLHDNTTASISTVEGITTFKSELFNIDRADFNVKYGSKRWIEGLKDKFINDLVEMSFTVVTK